MTTKEQEIAMAQVHRQMWENCTSRPFTTREAEFATLVRNAVLEEAARVCFAMPAPISCNRVEANLCDVMTAQCESDVVAQYEESTSGGFESIYTLHKLYAAPKALAPLTEPERKKMWHDTFEAHSRWSAYEWFSHGIQRAEAAHGIGGAP